MRLMLKVSSLSSTPGPLIHYIIATKSVQLQKPQLINNASYQKELSQNIHPSLKRYFPHILNTTKDADKTLKLQSIPFPSLAELHLHWDIGPNAWDKIIDEIIFISSEMGNTNEKITGSSSWLYEDKLKERYLQFLSGRTRNGQNSTWWENQICINGKSLQSLDEQIDDVLNQLSRLSQNSTLQLIHGDLCFNNILCDPVFTSICLIDQGVKNQKI